MRKVICYYQVDLAGDIAAGCGSDWTWPIRDGRRRDEWNIEAASQHTEFMISRGAVGMRMCEWKRLDKDRPVGTLLSAPAGIPTRR